MHPLKIRTFSYITTIPLINIEELIIFTKDNSGINQAGIYIHTFKEEQ